MSAVHTEIQNVMSYIANIANYVSCLKYHTSSFTKKIMYLLTEIRQTTDTPAKTKISTSGMSLT